MEHKFVAVVRWDNSPCEEEGWRIFKHSVAICIACREAARANALEFARQNSLSEYEYEVIEIVRV